MNKSRGNVIIVFLVALVVVSTAGYLYLQKDNKFFQKSADKLRVCPEHWVDNQMPGSCQQNSNMCVNRQYFIVNGKRKEFNEIDVDWVKHNCSLNIETVY